MKKYLSKTKIIALIAITLITTTVAASVFTVKLKNENGNAEVSYVGDVNNLPVYRLSLKNKTNDVYFVSVSDKKGNVVYCQEVQGANIVRNYQFDNKIYNNEYDLTFTVTDLKGRTAGTYNITKSKKVVSEISVNEIK